MSESRRALFWLGLAMVSAAGVAAVFVLAEVAVRLGAGHNNDFATRALYNLDYLPSAYSRLALLRGQEIYELGEDGRVRLDRRRFRVNRHSLRAEDDFPVEKPPGEIRIAFLGGSHVFDLNCFDYEDCPGYPALAGRRLREQGWPVRVLNAGRAGQDSRAFAALLSLHLHRFSPDLVVLTSSWNDIKWMSRLGAEDHLLETPPSDTFNPLVREVSLLDRLFGASALYRKIRDHFWIWRLDLGSRELEGRVTAERVPVDRERALAQYRMNFAAAVAVSRAFGALPVLSLEERLVARDNDESERRRIGYPMVSVETHDELVDYFDACDEILRSLARSESLPLIELEPELRARRAEHFWDHVHTTRAGSQALATGYARELASILGGIDGLASHHAAEAAP